MIFAEVRADREQFDRVAHALQEEADGRVLREELAGDIQDILRPARARAIAELWAMETLGVPHGGEPLRQAVAANVVIDVKMTSRTAMARVRARKTPGVRGFVNAAKRLDAPKGWQHPTRGGRTVTQRGAPGWFSDPMRDAAAQYRVTARRAVDNVAERIGRKG